MKTGDVKYSAVSFYYNDNVIYWNVGMLTNFKKNIDDYIEQYINAKESIIKKEFWKCAILFVEKRYKELEPLIFQLKDTDIMLLKQYIAYMQAVILYEKGELDIAKEKFKFVCENGGTLEIADICNEAIKNI